MKAGDIVLMRFPFSDLSGSKRRPAMILAVLGSSDFIACQITTNPLDPSAIEVKQADFAVGSLRQLSYVRPGKLFTANRRLIIKIVGRLKLDRTRELKTAVVNLIQNK